MLDGIRYHSMLLMNGTFRICANCQHAIHEYQTYRWDEKACNRGEDKPKKDNDHVMDSIRYALFTHWFESEGPRMTAEQLDEMRNEIYGVKPQHGGFFDQPNYQMGMG